MATSPDFTPVCSPDSVGLIGDSLDSVTSLAIQLGASVDFFCAAKAAEGASPRTVEWYRMILVRAVRHFGAARPVDAIPAAELRACERHAEVCEGVQDLVDEGVFGFPHWVFGDDPRALPDVTHFLDQPRPRLKRQTETVDKRLDPRPGECEDPPGRELGDLELQELDRRASLSVLKISARVPAGAGRHLVEVRPDEAARPVVRVGRTRTICEDDATENAPKRRASRVVSLAGAPKGRSPTASGTHPRVPRPRAASRRRIGVCSDRNAGSKLNDPRMPEGP